MASKAAVKNKKRLSVDAGTIMTWAEVIELIKAEQGSKSVRAFALEMGVTPAYLGAVLTDPPNRSPGKKILDYFGIGKQRRTIVKYVFFKK